MNNHKQQKQSDFDLLSPSALAKEEFHFSYLHSLQWGDVDAQQHVNNVAYCAFWQEARVRYYASMGALNILNAEDMMPVAYEVSVRFCKPTGWPDRIRIDMKTKHLAKTSTLCVCRMISMRLLDEARKKRRQQRHYPSSASSGPSAISAPALSPLQISQDSIMIEEDPQNNITDADTEDEELLREAIVCTGSCVVVIVNRTTQQKAVIPDRIRRIIAQTEGLDASMLVPKL